MEETAFIKDERPGEFEVRFSVRGEICLTINAESLEDAKAQAEAMTEDEDFGTEVDTAEEVRVEHVRKSRPMYLVTRNGRPMRVSRLEDGDAPRQPTERGF
jgi:hypothetical protein